jgi:membrane protease YdiL (CAAX protease family)
MRKTSLNIPMLILGAIATWIYALCVVFPLVILFNFKPLAAQLLFLLPPIAFISYLERSHKTCPNIEERWMTVLGYLLSFAFMRVMAEGVP